MKNKQLGDKQNTTPFFHKIITILGLALLYTFNVHAYGNNVEETVTVETGLQQKGKTMTITVVDESGPMPGANVLLKGTMIGNVTDADGQVTLNNIPDDGTLVVSYIGYVTREVSAGTQTNLTVQLMEDHQILSEVVVIGFGTLEKKQVTNAVTSIQASDMMVGVGGADISAALQGKVGGLIMHNLGSPNSGTAIQLRGMTSINAGQEPLIVIDGFPGGDFRSIAVDDIKSVDILKDASAAAIYGTRAAAGVILITTKGGSDTNGKVRLTYSTEFMKRQNYRKLDMLSGREYAERGIGTDYGHDVDWWDEVLNKDNLSQKHNISIESGTENAQILASFYYENQEGITYNDGREDYGGRINARFKLFDGWLEIRPNILYKQAARDNAMPNFQQALRNNPTRSPYDPESETGYNVWLNESMDYNILADAKLTDYYGLDKWFKPEVNLKLNIKAIPGLSYDQIVGYENRQWEYHMYKSKYHREELTNSRKGYAALAFSKGERITSQGYATYIKTFGEHHNLNTVAGFDYYELNGEGFNVDNYDFSVDGIKYWDIGKGSYLSDGKAGMSSSKEVTQRNFAVFARANYSYQDKYMLQGTIRREGSTKFADDNRWATFWSLSGAWRISSEKFMDEVSWLDDLKVRASYGITGNQDFPATYMANLLGSDTYWMLPSGEWAYSYGKTQNINPDLGWEETKELDLGLDFSVLNGRLYGKFDWYKRTIDNLLFNVKVPQPPYTQGSQWQNIGTMEVKGWEVELGGQIIKTNNFLWSSSMNIGASSGKIKTLFGDNTYINGNGFVAPGSPGDASRIEAGAKLGTFHLWKFAGFDDEGKFLLYNKDGEIIPADQKTENDKQYMGSYLPKAIIGWSHTLVYKNWDLGINLRSWLDFDVYNTYSMYFGIQGQSNMNVLKDAYGKYDHIRGEKQICDYYLEDGSFLKIDAITLGYTLPMLKYTKFINNIRIYGTLGNVFTFTNYSGRDPEVKVMGWDQGTDRFWDGNNYPVVRTYTLGLKLNF